MAGQDSREQAKDDTGEKSKTEAGTRSGNPNAEDPSETDSTDHKSGYGGEAGKPRTSSDQRKGSED